VSEQPTARSMWEERFGADAYLYGTEPNDFLRARVAGLAPCRVLCLAEGEGRNAVFLAEQGHEVHSVDLTEAGVAKTVRLAEQRGVQVDAQVGDLAVFDIGVGRWDVVVSIFAHMPPHVRRDLHARVVDALRPGGALILEAYTPDQIGRGTGGPSLPEMTMTLDGLRDELAGLTFQHADELTRDVVEGPGHTGVGAVVQIVARKPA
jgi:SAM-dependent methyltransferase